MYILLGCTPLTIVILCVNRLDDTDPVGAGEDDGSMLLPCEFCNELFPLDILVQHQVKREGRSTMRGFTGAHSGTYLYSLCVKPGISTMSARESARIVSLPLSSLSILP